MMRALFAVLFLFLSVPIFAQEYDSEKGDPAIKKALEKADLKYTLSAKGNYKVVMRIDGERTQQVVVNSRLYEYEGVEVREIWATVTKLKTKRDLDQGELFAMLLDNSTNKIGALQIDEIEGTYVVNFSMRVPADLNADDLEDLISLAATNADKNEKILTDGADEF